MLERHAKITEVFTAIDERGKRHKVLKLTEFYQLDGKTLDTEGSDPNIFYEIDGGERLTQISETEFRRFDSEVILRRE